MNYFLKLLIKIKQHFKSTSNMMTPQIEQVFIKPENDVVVKEVIIEQLPNSDRFIRYYHSPADSSHIYRRYTAGAMISTLNGATTFCMGDSVQLDAGAGFASYVWSTGATTRKIIVKTTA